MKKIITTDVVDPNIAQPFTARSLDFLQDAIKAALLQLANSSVGLDSAPSSPFILWGCVETDIGSGNFSCTAGAIMDAFGEVYEVDAVASTATSAGNSSFKVIITNDPTADPVTFTDATSKNVHNIRKAKYTDIGADLSLTTIALYDSFVRSEKTLEKVIDIGDWNMTSSATLSVAHGLTLSKIRGFDVVIIKDGSTELIPLSAAGSGYTEVDGSFTVGATNVDMGRRTGGLFDVSGNFITTSFNRGFITIRYTL